MPLGLELGVERSSWPKAGIKKTSKTLETGRHYLTFQLSDPEALARGSLKRATCFVKTFCQFFPAGDSCATSFKEVAEKIFDKQNIYVKMYLVNSAVAILCAVAGETEIKLNVEKSVPIMKQAEIFFKN